MDDAAGWALLLGVLGAVFGSHIATVAIRWPEPARGRSRCDGCAAPLRWWNLVPLLSWVALRGRCSRCGARIALIHPAAELIGLAIGVSAGLAAPGVQGVTGAVFGWLLLLLASVDIVSMRLPNVWTLALALAGMASAAVASPTLADRAIGGIAGYGALWLVAAVYRALRGRDGLGGGDAKLFGAIGLWLGWRLLPHVLLGASLIGLGVVATLMLLGRRPRATDRLPFGAMLSASAYAIWLLTTI